MLLLLLFNTTRTLSDPKHEGRIASCPPGSRGSRPSSSVKRAVGKTLGMRASRLATTVKLPLALLSWSGAQERAEPWQAKVAPTRPRTWRSFSR